MKVDISDFQHNELSNCCGATMYNYNDALGICSDCREWSESEADYERGAHRAWASNETNNK